MLRVFSALIIAVGAYFGIEYVANKNAEHEVLRSYDMVKRTGKSPCFEAMSVEGFYLSIGDEENYQKWVGIREGDCK